MGVRIVHNGSPTKNPPGQNPPNQPPPPAKTPEPNPPNKFVRLRPGGILFLSKIT